MPYDSPSTIRRRQVAAENCATGKRVRRAPAIKIPTDSEWAESCEIHLELLRIKVDAGNADSAGAHAQHLVHATVWRRALQIQLDLGLRSYWKAADIAKHELLNMEVA